VKNLKKLPIILLVALFVVGFFYFSKDLYTKRQTVRTSTSGKVVLDASTSFRIGLVKSYVLLWLYNPIFGVGPGQAVEQGVKELEVSKRQLSRSAHNAYLHLLVENGLIGFFIFMGIIRLSLQAAGRMKLKGGFYGEMAACMQICVFSWLFSMVGGTEHGVAFVWVCLAFPLVLEKIYFLSHTAKKAF
jgi:O-antigen ligase